MTERPHTLTVVTVGEILMDLIAPDAESLEDAQEFLPSTGGAPANVAVAVAKLGGQSAIIGAVGNDPFGRRLRQMLSDAGVELADLQTFAARTTLAFVARNAGGIPEFVFYRGADAQLKPEHVSAKTIHRAAFLYVSSMALMSEPSAAATSYATEIAREAGVLIVVDPNLRPSSWPSLQAARETVDPLIHAADVLKINDEEARLLADTGDLERAIDQLARDDILLVVTLGSGGCRWRWGRESGSVATPQIEVRETTGAGDAFTGALLVELATQGFQPTRRAPLDVEGVEHALRFACGAGAVACTRPGAMTALPTRAEVNALLR